MEGIQQKRKVLYQQIGLKFRAETSRMLNCIIALHGAETWMLEYRSYTPGKF
jgi:hypothetical protein